MKKKDSMHFSYQTYHCSLLYLSFYFATCLGHKKKKKKKKKKTICHKNLIFFLKKWTITKLIILFLFIYYQVLMIYNLDLQFPHSCQDNLFQRNVHKARECWNFLWGSISGGTWAPFNTIFKVQSPKFQKSMFLVSSVTCVIGINYLYVDRAKIFFFKNAPISTPGVSNESSVKSRWRIPNLRHLQPGFHHFFI